MSLVRVRFADLPEGVRVYPGQGAGDSARMRRGRVRTGASDSPRLGSVCPWPVRVKCRGGIRVRVPLGRTVTALTWVNGNGHAVVGESPLGFLPLGADGADGGTETRHMLVTDRTNVSHRHPGCGVRSHGLRVSVGRRPPSGPGGGVSAS